MPRVYSAATAPDAAHPDLQGRTYAIPFEDVWQGVLRLVRGKLSGWSLEYADDEQGIVVAQVDSALKSLTGVVEVRIGLDSNAQTRVDACSIVRDAYHDFGASSRRLRRFFRALDREAVRERDLRRRRISVAH